MISCCCRLDADDVLLYKVIRSDDDCVNLQSTWIHCRSGKITGKWCLMLWRAKIFLSAINRCKQNYTEGNRIRGFLYCTINYCSSDIKNRCNKIFIQPILEYTSILWSHYYVKYINKLMNMTLLVSPTSSRTFPGEHCNKEKLAIEGSCYIRF